MLNMVVHIVTTGLYRVQLQCIFVSSFLCLDVRAVCAVARRPVPTRAAHSHSFAVSLQAVTSQQLDAQKYQARWQAVVFVVLGY